MKRHFFALLIASIACFATTSDAIARKKNPSKAVSMAAELKRKRNIAPAGVAEARLIEIYQLVAQARIREAFSSAESLVHDYPHFQLGQLVYGDLLAAHMRPVQVLGDVPESMLNASGPALKELRDESQMRLKALRERPPPGTIPSQFLTLSSRNKHAIAVDASRSRLYLFENRPGGLTLIADYYVSIGKYGLEKTTEGDFRTPLGVYFITSNLDPKSLKDYYGSGALPINYPNALDNKRGKTGGGIWLHGTPSNQFSRPPLATDGCVVLANPDLSKIIQLVAIRTTPVVIAQHLNWVALNIVRSDSKPFEEELSAWKNAKSSGNLKQILNFYSPDFKSNGKTLTDWTSVLRDEGDKGRGRSIQLKDLSMLRWTDTADTMVVTFGEVVAGTRSGPTKRQYWERHGTQWKIFFEGAI